jgi:hypothetical protein
MKYKSIYWSNKPTNSMEQNPSWEANSRSANQNIFHPSWSPKVYSCCIHTLKPCFFNINFYITFHPRLGLPNGLYPSLLSNGISVYISRTLHDCYIHCPPHPHWFDLPNNTEWLFYFWNLLYTESHVCLLRMCICGVPCCRQMATPCTQQRLLLLNFMSLVLFYTKLFTFSLGDK